MTASITLVNTSNGKGEEYHVTVNGQKTLLRPGESVVAHHDADVDIDFERIGKPLPFFDGDKQVAPKVTIAWKEIG